MSQNVIVAARYAKALFEVVAAKNKISETIDELQLIIDVMRDQPEFKKMIEHPHVESTMKVELVKKCFTGQLSEEVINLLVLLIERKRINILENVQKQYDKMAKDALGRAVAVVYSPKPLNEQEKVQITEKFGKMTGKTIEIENVIDASLLGGLKVRIGDKLFDGSLASKLDKLSKMLTSPQAL